MNLNGADLMAKSLYLWLKMKQYCHVIKQKLEELDYAVYLFTGRPVPTALQKNQTDFMDIV